MLRTVHRRFFSKYAEKRSLKAAELAELSEIRQASIFTEELRTGSCAAHPLGATTDLLSVATQQEVLASLQAGMATFALHVEARRASALGEGFYTIGPCGEELLAAVGLVLNETDPVALHYRHLATQIARHARPLMMGANGLQEGGKDDGDGDAAARKLYPLYLDRARGYVVSSLDPVTGGAHCALGGGAHDHLVTSTLASQATPAVGRALAPGLMAGLNLSKKSGGGGGGGGAPPAAAASAAAATKKVAANKKHVSYVSVGDGSVNNSHFLSAVNMAKYAAHKGMKCPVLFGISDNGLCISLRDTSQWLKQFTDGQSSQMLVERCDGRDLASVFAATRKAVHYVRSRQKPAVLVFESVPRRFGHAATDRQSAYLPLPDIASHESCNPLGFACHAAVEQGLVPGGWATLHSHWLTAQELALRAFQEASTEPKLESLGRQHLVQRNHAMTTTSTGAAAAAAAAVKAADAATTPSSLPSLGDLLEEGGEKSGEGDEGSSSKKKKKTKTMVMRKMMTKCIDESLKLNPGMVYLGEDVEHGGYYLVTDGLAKKYPNRVRDMPPDETSLLGMGWGIAQQGKVNSSTSGGDDDDKHPLVVVVEIPYAKYLDCAADMLHEIVTTNWMVNHSNATNNSNNTTNNSSTDNSSSSSESSSRGGGGQESRCVGMVIRLQGFDRGVFGGNFHTHNALALPPGLDVVVHSNGADWCRGWRGGVEAAKQGRVVMVVDSTDLLNRRHFDPVNEKDGAMMLSYPELLSSDTDSDPAGSGGVPTSSSTLSFDAVLRHDHSLPKTHFPARASTSPAGATLPVVDGNDDEMAGIGEWDDVTIVTYGTGVVAARNAQRRLVGSSTPNADDENNENGVDADGKPVRYAVGVVEVPCVSAVPEALAHALSRSRAVLFADPCKPSQAPLLHFAASLKTEHRVLGRQGGGGGSSGMWWRNWDMVTAQQTYNPLGSTVTFLSEQDVVGAAKELLEGIRFEEEQAPFEK